MPVRIAPVPEALARAAPAESVRDRRMRWLVLILAVVGAAAFAASFFLPWWNFHMVAPQYPKGLDVQISLRGVTGDVAEVDILNHYVGMRSLSDAASFERGIAGWAVSGIALSIAAVLIGAGRKLGWFALVIAFALPLGFVGDMFGWMYTFGHNLDPKAPFDFPVFTPTMIGAGTVGQFHTWAWPAVGFWVAIGGVVLVIAAEVVRRRVCRACPHAGECGATCPRLMVLPPRPEPT